MKREYVTGIEKIGGKFVVFTEDGIYEENKSLGRKFADEMDNPNVSGWSEKFAQIAKEHYQQHPEELGLGVNADGTICPNLKFGKALEEA